MSTQTEISGIPELNMGQRLRISRENAGLEQMEMAAILELSRGAVSGWERNITKPKGLVLHRWAEVTHVNEWWLRTGHAGPDGPDGGVRREGLEPPTRWLKVA